MKRTCLLALTLLVSATAVSAANDDKNNDNKTAATDQKPKPAKEKKICRTDNATGSRVEVRRTCMTKAEWDALAANTQRDLSQTINHSTNGVGMGQTGSGQ